MLVVLFLLCALLAPAALADLEVQPLEQGIVRIFNFSGEDTGTGTGFLLNQQGYIATNHHVIEDYDELIVLNAGSEIQHDGQVVWASVEYDLAVVKIANTNRQPLLLSTNIPVKGSKIFALGFPGDADHSDVALDATLTDGIVGRIFDGAWNQQVLKILQHSAPTNPGSSGGPLFNPCGEVVGVNTQAALTATVMPDGSLERVPSATGIFWSSSANELMALLDDNGIAYQVSSSPCVSKAAVSTDQGAREQAQQAQQQALAAQKNADDARSAAQQAAAATADLATQAQGAQADLQNLKDQSRLQQSQFKRFTRQLMGWGFIAVVLLASLFLLVLRRPRQRIVQVFEEQISKRLKSDRRSVVVAKQLAPDIALNGYNAAGDVLNVKLSKSELKSTQKGLSLGRQQSLVDIYVDSQGLSKRHARFSAKGVNVYIEDLNSTNGTVVQGTTLSPFEPVVITIGMQLRLGDVDFQVSKA